jgi:hypothetical protein
MKRNNISEDEARKRIAMHWPQHIKAHLSDYEIKNPGTPEQLQETFANVDEYLRLSCEAPLKPEAYCDNNDYRKLVRNLARMTVTQVLQKMGDIADIDHKDGSAELCLQVNSKSKDGHGHDIIRGKKISVSTLVCVSNIPPATALADHSCCPPAPPCPPTPPPPPPLPPPRCRRSISSEWLLMLFYVAFLVLLYICHSNPRPAKSPCSSLSVPAVRALALADHLSGRLNA